MFFYEEPFADALGNNFRGERFLHVSVSHRLTTTQELDLDVKLKMYTNVCKKCKPNKSTSS